jgi:hypothetical protein
MEKYIQYITRISLNINKLFEFIYVAVRFLVFVAEKYDIDKYHLPT